MTLFTRTGEEFSVNTKVIQLFTQPGVNDLIRDLDLPKESVELLDSRLKKKKRHEVPHSRGDTVTERKISFHIFLKTVNWTTATIFLES